MTETLIKVENVSKKFCRDLKRSLWYGLNDLGNELLCRPHNNAGHLRKKEFWAVRDIKFELKRGECLGLIGCNGAGKTTLLRMLNGLIKPDDGKIEMRGRVGALIALGAGFNPLLTGRENIYINAAVLGLSKHEVDEKFDEIVEFSELGEFIDTPIKNYSSGMQVRLGFSISTVLEPDILLLDEVLAVGDIGFRAKCFNAISKLMAKTAVVFVSHSMPQVSRTCTNVIVMNHGRIEYKGSDVPVGIEAYYSKFTETESRIAGSGRAEIRRIELENEGGEKGITAIRYNDRLRIHLYFEVERTVTHPNIVVSFFNKESQVVAQCNSFFDSYSFKNPGGILHCILDSGRIKLNPGNYSLGVTVTDDRLGEVLLKHLNILSFRVTGSFHGYAPIILSGDWFVDQYQNERNSL
jgi:lipopolysaccharide transport system ATP-binding protein